MEQRALMEPLLLRHSRRTAPLPTDRPTRPFHARREGRRRTKITKNKSRRRCLRRKGQDDEPIEEHKTSYAPTPTTRSLDKEDWEVEERIEMPMIWRTKSVGSSSLTTTKNDYDDGDTSTYLYLVGSERQGKKRRQTIVKTSSATIIDKAMTNLRYNVLAATNKQSIRERACTVDLRCHDYD